ncbi:MAG: outer membrane lipoprotein carrier protein [Saprospiraceae bacterium]|jgi:outer membrane lipoprotein carrier protein
MKTTLAVIAISIFGFSFVAPSVQKDAKATEILNKVSAKTKAYKTITADFTYSVKSEDINEKQKGKLQLKGDKYKYSIFGITKISDGKKICTISDADEEVIITNVDFNDADEFSPSEIFTIYQSGYKYRYIKETTLKGKTYHIIELYPETEKNNPYRRITMYINKTEFSIYKINFYHKTSSKVFSISIDKASYNTIIADTVFKCGCGIKKDYDCDDQTGAK